MKKGAIVRATDAVAVGGVTLPAWWDALQTASVVAGALVPILSAAWLAFQIGRGAWIWWQGGRNGDAV